MDTQLSIQTSKKAPEPKATMPVIDLTSRGGYD